MWNKGDPLSLHSDPPLPKSLSRLSLSKSCSFSSSSLVYPIMALILFGEPKLLLFTANLAEAKLRKTASTGMKPEVVSLPASKSQET